jgi:2'-5' RNA ligase
VRLFVSVSPPAVVLERLRAVERPDVASVRWTTERQWHTTLRFLGEVADPMPVARALRAVPAALAAAGAGETRATMGPGVAWFPGRQVLQVPVRGLDALARSVRHATEPWGARRPEHAFVGHLTLARARGRARGPASMAGGALEATWRVDSFELMSSVLGPQGSRYDTVATVALDDAPGLGERSHPPPSG